MKTLIFTTMIFSSITCTKQYNTDEYIEDIVYKMVKSYKTGYSERKTKMIIKYSKKYGIDTIVFSKLQNRESSGNRLKVNINNTCFGLFQVSTNYWSHLPYAVCDKRYAKWLHKHKGTNMLKVFFFIEANTEMGAIILREYLNQYDGCYRKALIRYGGWLTAYGRKHPDKRDKYLKDILGD